MLISCTGYLYAMLKVFILLRVSQNFMKSISYKLLDKIDGQLI